MNSKTAYLFCWTLVSALMLGLVGWAVFSNWGARIFWGATTGYLLGGIASCFQVIRLGKNSSNGFQTLGIFFLIKLVLLGSGILLLVLVPELADYRAFALGFVTGVMLSMAIGLAFMNKAISGVGDVRNAS